VGDESTAQILASTAALSWLQPKQQKNGGVISREYQFQFGGSWNKI
jgi:hypothetical protein